mgnify:CR=1 FL=1
MRLRWLSPLLINDRLDGGNVPTAAAQQGLSAERSDRPTTQPGYDRNVLIAAGHQIEKLPLSEISRPMTGHQPIAVAAESNRHRQLRPTTCR